MVKHPFAGRTVQVVRDLSTDEQWYLYKKTRELKEALGRGESIEKFRIHDPNLGVYLLFMEDSTRTKESFRNAAKFHGTKVNDFDARSSSFQKKENLTDTVKMLVGYSERNIFVIRSKTEGVCRWLEGAMADYSSKIRMPQPSFINGGDGRHEHPTQEFLDEISFLEQLNWDRSSIHLALVGDLFHGRTVHSKVDGLSIFREVRVDLIAPNEIAMPPHYVSAMKEKGFEVRIFESLDEYLSQEKSQIAKIWYFTRLQLERMGDKLQDKASIFRKAVTFQRDFIPRVSSESKFFHPLPRHSESPTIPMFLDSTTLNGWDEQSRNGYFSRIVLMGMVAGSLGQDFSGESRSNETYDDPYIHTVPVIQKAKKEYKIGIRPVQEGIVIDHIGRGMDPEVIWEHITTVRRLLKFNLVSSHGVYHSESDKAFKGIISLPATEPIPPVDLQTLAAAAPGSTFNVIRAGKVREKYRLSMPPRVTNLEGLRCKNEDCISNPTLHEPSYPDFLRTNQNIFLCRFCETPHTFNEIWDRNLSR